MTSTPWRCHWLKRLGAPGLAIEHQGQTPLGTEVLACLRDHLLLDHGQQVPIDRAGGEEQRFGHPVVDPHIRGRRDALAALLHKGFGQRMLAPGVGVHMAVDVEHPERLGRVLRPLRGQGRGQLRRVLLLAELGEFAPQGLDLRDPIEPQQQAQLPGPMRAQALDVLDAQQRHQHQAQQDRLQAIEPGLERGIHPLGVAHEAFAEDRRQGQQHARVGNAFRRHELRGGLCQLALAGQDTLLQALDRGPSALRLERIALGALARRVQPPRRCRAMQAPALDGMTDRRFTHAHRPRRLRLRATLVQTRLSHRQDLRGELVRTPRRPPAAIVMQRLETPFAVELPIAKQRRAVHPQHRGQLLALRQALGHEDRAQIALGGQVLACAAHQRPRGIHEDQLLGGFDDRQPRA